MPTELFWLYNSRRYNTSIRRGGEGNEEDGVHQTNKHFQHSVVSGLLLRKNAEYIL